MASVRKVIVAAVCLLAVSPKNTKAGFSLDSCSVTWDGGDGFPRGPPGPPGEPCDCSRYEELLQQSDGIDELLADFGEKKKFLCDAGYHQASNKLWYKVFQEEVTYATAKDECAKGGGRLASKGMRDSTVRSNIINALVRGRSQADVWIGLDDLISEDSWVWSDGDASTQQNTDWYANEPSGGERCGHLLRNNDWKVNDNSCSREMYFMCERPTI